MPWDPTSIVTEDWGRLQVVFNDIDVTYFRDVPCEVLATEFNEPFGDGPAQIRFPQITSFEQLPTWAPDFANVEINQVNAAGAFVKNIWEGMVVSQGDSIDDGVVFDLVGALYQLDFYKKSPSFDLDAQDIGRLISSLINPRISFYGLRLNYMTAFDTGLFALNRGSWQPMLTGYIQDILGTATLITDLGKGIAVGLTSRPGDDGYWVTGSEGMVLPFGAAGYYGSRARLALNKPIAGMTATPSGLGYWLGAEDGGVFAYGDATFYGSLADVDLAQPIVEIERTNTGHGYWLVAKDGGVFAFGDATFYGSALGVADGPIIDMTSTPAGDGYWLLANTGSVYAYGAASYEGNASGADPWVAIERHGSDGYWLLNATGLVEAKGSATHYGDMHLVTLNKPMADMSSESNGTGYWLMAEDGGVFAFSDMFFGSVPEYNGVANQYTLTKQSPRKPVLQLKDRTTVHWTLTCGTPGVKHNLQRDLSMSPNCLYGEGMAPDGCHWRNTRYPESSTIDSAFFMPLARLDSVEPFLYNADGSILADNPAHNPALVRIEDYDQMGDQLTLREGIHSSRARLVRDLEPGWHGSITLDIDPEEGSRLDIRAGQNILFKSHRNNDRLYHIARSSIDWKSLKVTLTVDTKARDLLTIAGILTRDRDINDPTKRPKPTRRNSKLVEDRVAIFDCEAGAGVLKPTGAQPAGWTVQRIPFAERGTIMKTFIHTEPAIEFAVAVFHKEWSASSLHTKMPDGPFSFDDAGKNPWDSWLGDDDPIMVWGGVEQPAGYSPELKNPDNEITGDLIDTASWYYESKTPPWLWVALFHEESFNVEFSGTFTPGVLAAN